MSKTAHYYGLGQLHLFKPISRVKIMMQDAMIVYSQKTNHTLCK